MEVNADLEDIRQLLVQARRENSKRLLSGELARLEAVKAAEEASKPRKTVTDAPERVYEKKLSEYAWDQSDKFVKFYITLKNVQSLAQDAVTCTYTERGFSLRVEGVDNKNCNFSISNLLKPINTANSKVKVKEDMVLVMLAKTSSEKWSHVTLAEKQADDAKNAKYDRAAKEGGEASDPSAGIMDLMKKMYDEGDDEMKRTIKKAWSESRDKQSAEGLGSL